MGLADGSRVDQGEVGEPNGKRLRVLDQSQDLRQRLLNVYERLYATHGLQRWWPAETPFEVIVGAILTQSAAWVNVEKAIGNLRAAGALEPEPMRRLSEGELARAIYPSGYFNAKARKLKAFLALLSERFEGDLEALLACPADELRPLLLATHGIGPETADSILLYAAGRPLFVVDAYTRRLFSRLALAPTHDNYEGWQRLFMDTLPPEGPLFNEYHALIVRHVREVCRKRPLCPSCPLLPECPEGQKRPANGAMTVAARYEM
jgi:endonuclease-3 related protein